MNYWLHRISHHAEVSYPLLWKNKLSIGFSDFATQEFIDKVLEPKTWEKRWQVLETEVEEMWGNRPRTRHNLWRFIEGFKKGDRVIVPSWGVFSVYEIVSDKPKPISELDIPDLKDWNKKKLHFKGNQMYRDENHIDLGFYWEVKPLEINMSRKDFADAPLTSRMKIRTTNCNILNLKESVEKAMVSFENNRPINLHAELVEKIGRTSSQILKIEFEPRQI